LDRKVNSYGLLAILFLGVVLSPFVTITDAFGAEASNAGRKLWDNILLWVNFGILAFLFLKFARKPLMDYLRGVRTEVQDELDEVGAQFDKAKTLKDAEQEKMDKIGESIDKIRESILELGRREKERIIKEGKIAAQKIIEHAENYSRYRIDLARKALADEMVDLAFSMVEETLKKGISKKENEDMVNQFVSELEGTKRLLN